MSNSITHLINIAMCFISKIICWIIQIPSRHAILALLVLTIQASPAWALDPPVISISGTGFESPHTVTMTSSSGSILYTTNGTDPTNPLNSPSTYAAPFNVFNSTELRATTKLSSTYSTVTISYVNSALSIPPPLMWLRADTGVNTAPTNPTPVNSWADLSNNASNASASAMLRPLFKDIAINTFPAVKFDGVQQDLSLTSSTGFADFTNGASVFIVAKPTAITGGTMLLDLADSSSHNNIQFRVSSSGSLGEFAVYNGTTPTSVQTPLALTAGTYQLLEAVLAPGSVNDVGTAYVNGVAGTTNSTMNQVPNLSRTINYLSRASSGSNYYNGEIAEIILFSTALSVSQRSKLESYLIQKYQLLSQTPENPQFSLAGGVLNGPTQVTISTSQDSITYITTDNTTPTTSSPVYDGNPITVNYTQTLQAISVKNGVACPGVSVVTYTLDSSMFPAPNPSDTTTPSINIQLPVPSI